MEKKGQNVAAKNRSHHCHCVKVKVTDSRSNHRVRVRKNKQPTELLEYLNPEIQPQKPQRLYTHSHDRFFFLLRDSPARFERIHMKFTFFPRQAMPLSRISATLLFFFIKTFDSVVL